MSWGPYSHCQRFFVLEMLTLATEDDDWDAVKADKAAVEKPAAKPVAKLAEPEKSWEDEDKPEPEPAPAVSAVSQPKPAAKPAAKGKPASKSKAPALAGPVSTLTPDEEKRRRQDEVLKSDIANAKDIFSGLVDAKDEEIEKKLTTFVPITEADFEEFARMINERVIPSKANHNYMKFMKSLMRHLTSDLKAEDIKGLSATLSAIQNEHLAAEKAKEGSKGKKKTGKAAAKKTEDFAEEDFVDDDLDAFI